MIYEIYVDVLFLVDFLCSLLALSLTAKMLKRKLSLRRAVPAAALGGLWSCLLTVYPVFPVFAEVVFTALFAGSVMAAFTFQLKDLKAILKADGMLLASCVAMGGALMSLKQFLYLKDWEALFCLGAVYFAVGILVEIWTSEKEKGQERYQVRLYYRGKMKCFLALCDSGNRLREPVSQKPVSVIAYEDCKGFCDKVVSPIFIPFRAVGTESGLLTGLIFEKMEILNGEEWLVIDRPIVAVSKETLSDSRDFTMLLPEALLNQRDARAL